MTGRFIGLVSSKVAIAALGGLLLAGGVSTMAFAAQGPTSTPMTLLGSMHAASSHGTGNHHDTKNSKGHTPQQHTPHIETVAIQGTLTQYDSTNGAILVTGKAEDNDNHGKSGHDTDITSGSTTSCTLTSPFTIALVTTTKINGQAKTASDLANDIGHKVEVQAQEGSSCTLTATKVTVAATTGQSNNKSHTYVGAVQSVGTSSFIVQPKHGSSITVNVTPTTTFGGRVHQLSDLKAGMHVVIRGTMASGNTVQANHIQSNGHVHLH